MTPDQLKFHHSSNAQDWETPQFIFDALAAEFGFTVDAAALTESAKCERYWTPTDNGLAQDWSSEIVWLNPPYKNAEEWMKKSWDESRRGATVVCLVPARTDARWWHRYAMKAEIRLFTQRLKFKKGGKRSDVAPFPSALVVFRPPEYKFGITPLRLEANPKNAGDPLTETSNEANQ